MLKVGDIIYYKFESDPKRIDVRLSYGNPYEIKFIRHAYKNSWNTQGEDICITDDENRSWWFGQVGYPEPWTNWFITELE